MAAPTCRHRCLIVQVNKVHSVSTIALVALELDVDEDWLADLALGMDPEDGLIWVFSTEHEDGVMAFTSYGVENLATLVAHHHEQRQ